MSVALGRALTGHTLALTSEAQLAAQLEALGWSRETLAELRRECQERRAPWPFPIDLETLRRIGFARFDAALAEARELLGLAGLASAQLSDRPLNQDERRLQQDRPPHWG